MGTHISFEFQPFCPKFLL